MISWLNEVIGENGKEIYLSLLTARDLPTIPESGCENPVRGTQSISSVHNGDS